MKKLAFQLEAKVSQIPDTIQRAQPQLIVEQVPDKLIESSQLIKEPWGIETTPAGGSSTTAVSQKSVTQEPLKSSGIKRVRAASYSDLQLVNHFKKTIDQTQPKEVQTPVRSRKSGLTPVPSNDSNGDFDLLNQGNLVSTLLRNPKDVLKQLIKAIVNMNVNKIFDSISFKQIGAIAVLLSAGIGVQIFKSPLARKWIRTLVLITTLGVPFTVLLMLLAFSLAKLKHQRKQIQKKLLKRTPQQQQRAVSGYDTDSS